MKKSLYEYAIAKSKASRRTFLKGAAGAGAVAAMSGGLSSVATNTSPISASLAFLTTWEIIETPLIFKRGLPGSLVAESLEGIKIIVLDIIFIYKLCV